MIRLIEAITSIFDKLTPGRKERLQNEIQSLERQLERALACNDDYNAGLIRKRLSDLREKVNNTR